MLAFQDVAVFVLSTTYLLHRMEGISNTWGIMFPHLYFVLGTNKYDESFLLKNCRDTKGETRRRLKARNGTQTSPRDVLMLYQCRYRRNQNKKAFNAIYAGNCTGEYYGIGPTCRCQAAMRFFLAYARDSMFKNSQWLLFLDDDVYLRPFAVKKVLELISLPTLPNHQPVVLVSDSLNTGFRFSQAPALKNNGNACCNRRTPCKTPIFEFGFAQPAFINRDALVLMGRAVERNGLTNLHALYGGSHDILLGLLVWMHQITVYSFKATFWSSELNTSELAQVSFDPQCNIMFHKVKRRRRLPRPGLSPAGDMTAGHEDFAQKLNEKYFVTTISSKEYVPDAKDISRQELCGEKAFHLLIRKPGQTSILKTAFAPLAAKLSTNFSLFLPSHCAPPPQARSGEEI